MGRFAHERDPRDVAQRARSFLADGFARATRVRPLVYWSDLLLSAGLGWALFLLAARETPGGPTHLLATAGAVLAQMRALVFLHEISHGRSPRGFHLAWNLMVGIPMGVPSIVYVGSHRDHHRVDRFATEADPEYAPIAEWGVSRRALFVLTGALVPLLLVARWGLVAPLSALGGRLRRAVLERGSTLVINPHYRRRAPSRTGARRWLALECAAAAFTWTAAGLALAGALPIALVAQWFVVVGGVFALNQARTLVAHGYAGFGSRVDLDAQYRDSIDLAPGPVAALIAPLGLRYHALHHLLPELPYHALGRVRRALREQPGSGSPDGSGSAPGRGVGRALRLLVHGP